MKLLLLTLLASLPAAAQPSIGGVVNAASYSQPPVDSSTNPIGNSIIAQGAIFTIFGKSLGPTTLAAPSSLPLPTSLPDAGGTSVSVSAGGQTIAAYIVYTSAAQVSAILPSNTPVGAASITVTYSGQSSAPFKITVVASGLGVFTRNSAGNGPGIAQVARSQTDVTVNSLTNSAQAGDTLIVYGTGLGPITGADNSAPGVVVAGANVTVNVAGQIITPTYAGRSPNFPGLDQINFQLPANVATGCYIPAEITSSGRPSNLFYLSIESASKTCVHPLGLSPDVLAKLDNGGTANLGLFLMLRTVVFGVAAEGAGGVFDQVNADGAFQFLNLGLLPVGAIPYSVPSGACAVMDSLDPGTPLSIPDFSVFGGKEYVAAPTLSVASPSGVTQQIFREDSGGYLGIFFGFFGAGNYTLSGANGVDVNAFSATTALPANLVWSNAGNFASVPRSDVTLTWTGGNLNAQSLVTISGMSIVINPVDPTKSRGKRFYCNAAASAGKFVVPGSVLSQLPSSAVDTASGEVAFGSLGISTGAGSPFTATLKAGALDAGFLTYAETHNLQVTYQ